MKWKYVAFLLPIFLFSACSQKEGTAENTVFKVHTFTVENGGASTVLKFPGRVKPSIELMLAFKVSGRVQNVYVEEGDYVKKGQLVAEIDPKDYRDLLDAAQSRYDQVSAEAGRVIRLYKDNVVSANDYDKARYGLQTAASALEMAKRQLEDCKLYAPMDGYIQTKYSQPSSIVAVGLAVVNMVSAGAPQVEIDVPTSVSMSVKNIKSSTARFAENAVPPVPLSICGISPKANANQLYTMTFATKGSDASSLRPGMVAMVDIVFDAPGDSDLDMKIPSGALFCRNDTAFVWILSDDNTVHSAQVGVKSLGSDGTAVLHGTFPDGTRIVTAGVHKLHEGEKVAEMEKPSRTNVGGIL